MSLHSAPSKRLKSSAEGAAQLHLSITTPESEDEEEEEEEKRKEPVKETRVKEGWR